MAARAASAPPPVFGLVGHPLRWRLLQELAASDRRVRELTRSLQITQSLASYHLGRLRRAGLVFVRRSTNDGRDLYYALDLARSLALLSAAGAALHPALRPGAPTRPALRPARVLFLCTGNSARSQLAEALLRSLSDGVISARSAGSRPKALHPLAVQVLRARGIEPAAGARAKHWSAFDGERFDHVVTLCDRVREVCPEFPGGPQAIHWSIRDPAASDEGLAAFERTAAELETRIAAFLQRLAADPQPEE